MAAQHVMYIVFLFILGACVGSFLNVIVWRLPRVEHRVGDSLFKSLYKSFHAITFPGSHCPQCKHPLAARDNIPVLGWIFLQGKCRYCSLPISPKYPIFEALTGLLFAFYYICFFMLGLGPCAVIARQAIDEFGLAVPTGMLFATDWPILILYLFLLSALLAASLIDAETYTIPVEIPWLCALVGGVTHTVIDKPTLYGTLTPGRLPAAVAMGSLVGWIISLILLRFALLKQSFADGGPPLEIDKLQNPELAEAPPMSRRELNREMFHEIAFLFPPILLSIIAVLLVSKVPSISSQWNQLISNPHFSGFCGAILGAMIGAFTVWIVRILGSIGFGREAMGLGDVHLMFGVGAIVGAWSSTLAFFIAPFFGILFAIYKLLTSKGRELPYGPFLSLGTAAAMLCSCQVWRNVMPGLTMLGEIFANRLGL